MVDIEAIGISVDTSGVKAGARDLDALGRSADQASRKADNLGKTVNKGSKEIGSLGKSADLSTAAVARFGGAVGIAYSALQASRALVAAADQYTKLTAQIRNATRTQYEYNAAFADTTRIAKVAQSEIEGVTKLYARLNLALRDANRSQQEVATVTETVALALKVNGASVGESTSAMLQLSQAFGSGVLRGEEFNAVMEAAPNLMRQLATSMGIPIGQLRNLASEGQITVNELTKAFTDSKYLSALREQAKNVQTIGGAWQVFKNEVILSIGEIDKAVGGSSFFSSFISGLGMALKEASGRGGNTTVRKENPEDALFGNLKKGMFFGGLSGMQIGDTPEIVKKQKAAFDELAKTLHITSSEYEKMNDLQKRAKKALDDGAISATQYAQIMEGIAAERKKLGKGETEAAKRVIEIQQEQMRSVGDLADEIFKLGGVEKTHLDILQSQLDLMPRIPEEIRSAMQARIDLARAMEQENYWHEILGDSIEREIDQQNLLEDAVRAQTEARDAILSKSADEMLRREEDLNVALIYDDEKRVLAQMQLEYDRQEAYIRGLDDGTDATHAAVESMLEDLKRLYGMEIYKQQFDKQKKVWESIEKTAHDTFISIFDSGKSAFDRLRDTLKNGLLDLLYQMTIKKWIINVSAAVSGGTAGSAMASLMPGEFGGSAGGSSGFGMGSIKSMFDVVTKGFDAANNLFVGAINDFGASVANMGGVFSDVGGWIGQYSNTIASVAPFIPSVISILSGDVKGGIASGIGAGIGYAVGGPIGGAIGSALGSFVGGLFGKKSPPMVGSQASGTFSAGEFTGTFGKYGKKDIGAASSLNELNKAFATQLGTLLKAFGLNDKVSVNSIYRNRTVTRGFFGASFDGGNFYSMISKKEDFQTYINKVLGQELVKAIQMSKLPDGIRALFNGMTDKTQVTNMIQASINLNSAQEQLAERFGLTVNQAAKVSSATGVAGDNLIAFVNSLVGAANAFKTMGKVLIDARDNLTASFAGSGGGSLPATLNAFDEVLKGIDKTTQAGIEQFTELYAIRDSFNQYVQSIDAIKGGVKGSLFGIVSPAEQRSMMQADLAQLFGALNLQIPGSVQELINLGKSIDYTTEEGLNLAAAFPSLVQAFQQAREQTNALTDSLQSLDISRFATLVDYTRAVRYAESGINIANLPSYDVGTSFVPSDQTANIHQAERIFTAVQNADIVAAVQNSNGNNAALVTEIRQLREELKAGLYSVASNTGETARINRKWDGDGMPAVRTV